MRMDVRRTSLPEVLVVEHEVFEDERGFFMEVYRADLFAEHADLGLPSRFVQLNHSRSAKGVMRGLHFQWDPPMGKLMRVIRGEAFLVAVDIRPGSPTLGRYESVIASDRNRLQLWAPASFARGFCVLSDVAEIEYLTTGTYNSAAESGVRWDDPRNRHRLADHGPDPLREGRRGPVAGRVAGTTGGRALQSRSIAIVRILIAGGAGYIGTVLAPRLAARGYAVTVADLTWFGNHLPPEIPVVRKDVMSLTESDLAGTDVVIFLAGLSNDPMAEFSPALNYVHNAAAPANLAYLAKRAGVQALRLRLLVLGVRVHPGRALGRGLADDDRAPVWDQQAPGRGRGPPPPGPRLQRDHPAQGHRLRLQPADAPRPRRQHDVQDGAAERPHHGQQPVDLAPDPRHPGRRRRLRASGRGLAVGQRHLQRRLGEHDARARWPTRSRRP